MPTELQRLNVTFPTDLWELIERDAQACYRTQSGQVVWMLYRYYQRMKEDSVIFTPTLPHAVPGTQTEVPVFRSPLPEKSPVSKSRSTGRPVES